MKKKPFVSEDREYFMHKEDVIKLEFCKNDGKACKSQMENMNASLLLTRKFIENKDYSRALVLLKEAFDSTFDLKGQQCTKCGDLFRKTIINTLEIIVTDLAKMNKSFFGFRSFKSELKMAEDLLRNLKS